MKKILLCMAALGFGIAVMLISFSSVDNAYAGSGNCYLCGSGSSANQCRYYGSDSSSQRRKCKNAGCKISGTSSCSTAANVKVIDPNK